MWAVMVMMGYVLSVGPVVALVKYNSGEAWNGGLGMGGVVSWSISRGTDRMAFRTFYAPVIWLWKEVPSCHESLDDYATWWCHRFMDDPPPSSG